MNRHFYFTDNSSSHKIGLRYKTTLGREEIVEKSILSKREKEVFDLLITNNTTSDIAEKLKISEKTVRNHISNVMQKLDVKSRAVAVVELLKMKEISL